MKLDAYGGFCRSWLAGDGGLWGYISIAAVTATYGSALTAGHFWKDPKVTKRSSPHHSAPRLGSVCPHSGLNPWAAATRHPWRGAANPASCRVTHGFKPAFGQRGFTGRLRSTARSKARARSRAARFASWVRVGAGLPAMAVYRSQRDLVDLPNLPASQLPHWIFMGSSMCFGMKMETTE